MKDDAKLALIFVAFVTVVIFGIGLYLSFMDTSKNNNTDTTPTTLDTIEPLKEERTKDGFFFRVFHDNQYNVTCWQFSANGISCIPDGELK